MKKVALPINDLFLPFGLEDFHLSIYTLSNFSLTLFCFCTLMLLTLRNPKRLARPVFFVVVLVHMIFQIPLAVFSSTFEKSLINFIQFAIAVHAIVITGLVWTLRTPKLTQRVFPAFVPQGSTSGIISNRGNAFMFVVIAGLTGIYLGRISWPCTGLYAMLVDPELTLLARETSIKLAGSGFATLSYGILANVMCPLMAYTSVINLQKAWLQRQFHLIAAWAGVAFLVMLIVMLPGIKGNIIPTILLMGIGALIFVKKWLNRLVAVSLVLGLSLSFFLIFEALRERNALPLKKYEFSKCVERLETCQEAKTLLASLKDRDLSLGLSRFRLEELNHELLRVCTPSEDINQSETKLAKRSNSLAKHLEKERHLERKFELYVRSILYRACVIPIQVASWHFQYVTEYGSPGVYALPLAAKIFGSSIDVPNRVYLVYGSIYSQGDVTSTGTAPTSFLMAYPAYFGIAGIVLALAALLSFDLISSTIIGGITNSLRWAAIGLVSIGCINFMLSDFGTALLSHGTAFALLLLMVLSYIEKTR